ncbi:hypothetical protein SAMN04488057_114123 [Cyclobacterium lianum]|uniref:ER-bound oxygenase mpaB/mpaB'/Rubber oxygenase catalytic domain-containing protein n=1 Tax=Cyclobacterium lianum TaxID=388280 RepID=A0A1M7Q744_9BACT|nr:oxygenase MpaB family protein [Cyclobacterium lianum]SHN26244.1 hypothetical protein SAMN04488057_114123 [Cyclobacterium lianum]
MGKLDLYTDRHLNLLRGRTDELADKAVQELITDKSLVLAINSWESLPEELPETFPPALIRYFRFFRKKPATRDQSFIRDIQAFFASHSGLVLSLLGFYSLPYTYAFGDGAEVLVRSEKLVKNPGKRLAETALFVLECYRPGAFMTDQRILLVLAKVRLIHAMSRYFIRKYARDWDPEWGQPINQEDLLATNLSFSLLISRGIKKSNQFLSSSEREKLLAYWGLIGYYLGVELQFWPETNKEAFELERKIRKRHLRPSEAGTTLLQSLMGFYRQNLVHPEVLPFLEDLLQYYMGKEVSVALKLNASGKVPDWLLRNVMKLNLFGQHPRGSNFGLIYRNFLKNTRHSLGFDVAIDLSLPHGNSA